MLRGITSQWVSRLERRYAGTRMTTYTGPTGGAIGITREQWEAVNPYHEFPVMLEEDYGLGRYLASLDVFHQLHCVVSHQRRFPSLIGILRAAPL